MKKNILTGAIFMALSFTSYAQNTVSVNQAGTNQTVKATQKGDLQSATINQTQGSFNNEDNLADITQTGQGVNTVLVSQNDGSLYNRSFISQKNGSGNLATTEQNGSGYNTGKIEQAGNYNQGTIKQNNASNDNWVSISQELVSNYNTAYVEQGKKSTLNEVTIVQQNGYQGAGNEARVEQNGNGTRESYSNSVRVVQSNQGNKTLISQNALLGYDSFSNSAYSTQYGVNGSINIAQSSQSVAESSAATVVQTATSLNSKATVEQAVSYGGAVAYILQTGTGEALIRQFGGTNNYADVKQADGFIIKNEATVLQNGVEAHATIYQAGNNNKGTISQQNTSYNFSTIEQSLNAGNSNNVASIRQENQGDYYSYTAVDITQGTSLAAATNSQAFVRQSGGEANEVNLSQTGNLQFATITQSGYSNFVFGTPGTTDAAQQSGDHNTLTINQTSIGFDSMYAPRNIVYAIQAGSGNQATVTQTTN